jgi:hypothetical protein
VLKGDHFLLARSVNAGPNLASEVRRNLAVHAGQAPDQAVVAVYVGGKGAGELRERLKEVLEVPVHSFDPFAAGEVGQLPPGNRGLFAGPMGLLYHKAGGDLPVNWVSPRQPKPPADPNFARMRTWLVAGVALLVGLFIMGFMVVAAEESAISDLGNQKKDVDEKLKQSREQGKQLKAMSDWSNPSWVDEVYDLANRADVTKIRLDSLAADSLPRSEKTPSRWVGQLTMRGRLLSSGAKERRDAYDRLVALFAKEAGYYSIDNSLTKFEDTTFTLVVKVARRAPSDYQSQLDDPTVVKDKSVKTKSKS